MNSAGWKKWRKPSSLRNTLLFTYIVAAVVCFSVGLYNFHSARLLLDDMADFVETSQNLSEIQTTVHLFQDELEEYLFSRNSQSLQSYYTYSNDLLSTSEDLKSNVVYTKNGVKYKNLGNMISHYLGKSEEVVTAKRNERTSVYIEGYDQVYDEYRLINLYIQNVMAADVEENIIQYNQMQDTIQLRTIASYSLFAISFVLVVFFVIAQSNRVSRPITKLAGYAQEVAEGRYDITIEKAATNQEIALLYDTFETMVTNTKLYLDGLAEKQLLEKELAEERITGLEKDNLVKQAELLAMHSQMNPHFVFNTINIGARIAMLQGDEVVCDYLENVADVFRYNLAGLDDATLQEEMENVTAYMQILLVRFEGKLTFTTHADESVALEDIHLPRMTLQPLVENAYIYGVAPCEENGEITVDVFDRTDSIDIAVSNTGMIFPPEKISALYFAETNEHVSGHVSGIGLRNVIKRLQNQFGIERPLEVASKDGKTIVTLKIPKNKSAKKSGGAE